MALHKRMSPDVTRADAGTAVSTAAEPDLTGSMHYSADFDEARLAADARASRVGCALVLPSVSSALALRKREALASDGHCTALPLTLLARTRGTGRTSAQLVSECLTFYLMQHNMHVARELALGTVTNHAFG